MNTDKVEALVAKNKVVTIKADKTHENPAIDQLLVELGNLGKAIPFVVIYPAQGGEPIMFDGPITQQMVLDALEKAGPSLGKPRQAVAEVEPAHSPVAR